MVEYKFYNKEANFITALKIECNNRPRSLRIYGSHQHYPTDWDEIGYDLTRSSDSLLVTFDIPTNYGCFLIQIKGESIPFHHITSGALIPRSDAQIRDQLKLSSVAILCCARDCEQDVENSLRQLQNLGNLFGNAQMYIIENDSNDGTLASINLAIERHKIKIKLFTTKGLDSIFLSRTDRLSYCRNYLLEASKEYKYDYYIVADLDGVFSTVDPELFMTCFKYDCWTGCFPVSALRYYDLWALRHRSLMPGDYNDMLNEVPYVLTNDNAQCLITIPLRNLDFSKAKGWLEVDSAFGGFGVYKGFNYQKGRYHGSELDEPICEHVSFHKRLQSNCSRFYINPEFIIK
jgi:hypothetical protein